MALDTQTPSEEPERTLPSGNLATPAYAVRSVWNIRSMSRRRGRRVCVEVYTTLHFSLAGALRAAGENRGLRTWVESTSAPILSLGGVTARQRLVRHEVHLDGCRCRFCRRWRTGGR